MICYFDSITDVCVGYGNVVPDIPYLVSADYMVPDAVSPVGFTAEELLPYAVKIKVDKSLFAW